tara:strand:- start:187 stop:372 length:186 start_codon:yes stop_codon:yes gene_type:complete
MIPDTNGGGNIATMHDGSWTPTPANLFALSARANENVGGLAVLALSAPFENIHQARAIEHP